MNTFGHTGCAVCRNFRHGEAAFGEQQADRRVAVADAQLAAGAGDLAVDGVGAGSKLAGDLLGAQMLGHQLHALSLARRKPRGARIRFGLFHHDAKKP